MNLAAAALLLLLAQDAPPAPAEEEAYEDIVVSAKLGRTTMLFDKAPDGKLINCRIMVSSGSQARDVAACKATPVCYAGTADEVTDCRELTILDQAALIAIPKPAPAPAMSLSGETPLPKLIQPAKPRSATQAGPSVGGDEASAETERQRVTLPPLPQPPPSGAPVIRLKAGNVSDEEQPR